MKNNLIIEFSDLRLDVAAGSLRRRNTEIVLTPRLLALLTFLAQNSGKVVSKDQLMEAVWPNVIVTDDALTQAIRGTRLAIGDEDQKVIKTVHRRGYMLDGPVRTRVSEEDGRSIAAMSLDRRPRPTVRFVGFTPLDGSAGTDFGDCMNAELLVEMTRTPLYDLTQATSADLSSTDYIIGGRVRLSGEMFKVTAFLQQSDGRQLWAERFEAIESEAFDAAESIARRIAATTQLEIILNEGNRVGRMELKNLSLEELCDLGWRNLYLLNKSGLERACELGEEIVARDGSQGRGHQIIAVACTELVYMGFRADRDELRKRALTAGLNAVREAPDDAYSHSSNATALAILGGDSQGAVRSLQMALEINPNFSLAYGIMGSALAFAGKNEESRQNSLASINLNPQDPSVFFRFTSIALTYYQGQDFELCLDWACRASTAAPAGGSAMHLPQPAMSEWAGRLMRKNASTSCCITSRVSRQTSRRESFTRKPSLQDSGSILSALDCRRLPRTLTPKGKSAEIHRSDSQGSD